jgi:hypothetical protein
LDFRKPLRFPKLDDRAAREKIVYDAAKTIMTALHQPA